jgi:transposase
MASGLDSYVAVMLKRQMFGRARLDLLARRFLLAA